jgi:hypothetical protein
MKRGQTLVEYVLVVIALAAAVTATGFIVRAINRQHARSVTILSSDYP